MGLLKIVLCGSGHQTGRLTQEATIIWSLAVRQSGNWPYCGETLSSLGGRGSLSIENWRSRAIIIGAWGLTEMHRFTSRSGALADVERAAAIEEFWASRNAWADFLNAERLATWERKRAGILEPDLPPGHTYRLEPSVDPRVLPLRRRREDSAQDSEGSAKVPGHRFYWQAKSLQIPLP